MLAIIYGDLSMKKYILALLLLSPTTLYAGGLNYWNTQPELLLYCKKNDDTKYMLYWNKYNNYFSITDNETGVITPITQYWIGIDTVILDHNKGNGNRSRWEYSRRSGIMTYMYYANYKETAQYKQRYECGRTVLPYIEQEIPNLLDN